MTMQSSRATPYPIPMYNLGLLGSDGLVSIGLDLVGIVLVEEVPVGGLVDVSFDPVVGSAGIVLVEKLPTCGLVDVGFNPVVDPVVVELVKKVLKHRALRK